MALKISGIYYRILWDENKAEWKGLVSGIDAKGDPHEIPNVCVKTDNELEQVLLAVVHHLDDLVEDVKV